MIQGLRTANAFPSADPFPYKSPGAASGSSLRGFSAGSRTPGNVVAKVQKMELRLQQAEQSNRALLEELMRVQNDMKVSVRTNQQRLDEERQSRQQTETSMRALLSRLAEVERRAQQAEQVGADNKTALGQLANHSRSVQQALSASQQGSGVAETGLRAIQQQVDGSKAAREQLEKTVGQIRGELQELRGKVGDTSKLNTDARLLEMNSALQEIKNQIAAEQKARETLANQLNGRSLNDVDNNITKMNDAVHQRIAKLETMGVKTGEENLEQLSQKVHDLDDHVKKTSTEIEKILTAEIQARRDQSTLLKSKIHECNDNFRAGMLSLQGQKWPTGSTPENGNWKLDAVKVHQISQETADEVRKDLEKQVNDLKQQLKSMEENMKTIKKETDVKLNTVQENKNLRPVAQPVMNLDTAPPTSNATKHSTPTIIGNNMDQRMDLILFNQEKTKQQVNGLQHDVDGLMNLNKSGGLDDRFTALDRRVTARMDGETKNRTADVQMLKEDIDKLKKREIVVAPPVPAEHATAMAQQQKVAADDVKQLKEDMQISKTSFRKLAESVQVVKTTLGEKLNDEVRIRKSETGRLQQDLTKVVARLQEMED